MKRINYHGLRFQAILVAKLFVICIAVAIYLVGQRTWVESFLKESYSQPPASLQELLPLIKMGASIKEEYVRVPDCSFDRGSAIQ